MNGQVPRIGAPKLTIGSDPKPAYRGVYQIPSRDGATLIMSEGLTKREWIAAQMAPGCFQHYGIDELARISVDVADAILAECQRREEEEARQQAAKGPALAGMDEAN